MKKIITILLLTIGLTNVQSQTSRVLTSSEVENIFNSTTNKSLGITYNIFRVYNFTDNDGEKYLVLSEHEYAKNGKGNPQNDTIKAIMVKKTGTTLKKGWDAKDFISKNNGAETKESSIWFWTKYIDLKDLDGDGITDPIVVYGSSGDNGFEDGRVKILVYHKGVKRAIRHQNSVVDSQRKTEVDKEFYTLPTGIQNEVKIIMGKLVGNNQAIFNNYENNLTAKKTIF